MSSPPSGDTGFNRGSSPRLPPYLRSSSKDAEEEARGPESQQAARGPAPPPVPLVEVPPPTIPARPRPFVLTRGRVGDEVSDIGLETQVTASLAVQAGMRHGTSGLAPELRAIVALCVQPLSVAEISARLRFHLGVTKVLVSDLHLAGYVVVHVADAPNPRSPELILRVMHGLRAIS
ncbi:MAG: DUF742 domain-containing protein [Micromonosporaceae bacterium]|nr:DUF742 domain-containing protein [Micromonosporaceae bacterium]